MSTAETNEPKEEQSLENGKGEASVQAQIGGKVSPEATTNASVVSASDICGSVDDIAAETTPEDAPNASSDSKDETSAVEAPGEPTSNGECKTEEDEEWQDVLGTGQLMKKVYRYELD